MDDAQPSVLAVDVGTSALKAVLYDDAGAALRVAIRRYDYVTPQAGWAEGDPSAWWEAFCQATADLCSAGFELGRVEVVAFTGQMHSAVLLDERREVIQPTILWLDRRADQETEELQELLKLPPYELNSTYSLPKLLWLHRHVPETLTRTRTILWPKDYLRFRLTGAIATDLTESGGAALLDWPTRRWATQRLSLVGLDSSVLPPVLPADARVGEPLPQIAEELGINPRAAVLVGVGDVAALIGGAPPRPGRVVCSMGSSSMIFMAIAPGQEAYDPAGRLYVYPFLPPYRLAGGVSSTTGASLVWLQQQLLGGKASFDEAARQALEVEPGCDGLVFIPYLAGERSPYWSDDIRAGFYGLRLSHDARHATRAVMEGIAYSLRHLLDIYGEMSLPVNELVLAGGGTRTPGLTQMIADACGRDVSVYAEEESVTRVLYALSQQALGRRQLASALEATFKAPMLITSQHEAKPAYDAGYVAYRRFSDYAARQTRSAYRS